MPTPLELVLDPISLVIITAFVGLMVWEHLRPGRTLPTVPGWRARGLGAFAGFFFLSSYLPLLIDPHLAPFRLFDATRLGALGGAALAVLVYEAVAYVWHRSMHAVPALWRGAHQMHHSAERLDTAGAFYFSPLDMVGWTLVGSVSMVVVLGLTPEAATIALLTTTFLGMFQHANINTPHWLGYFIQRPESHTVHHARGAHRCNYSDLPIFDIVFGTFNNPEGYEAKTGFYDGASARVVDMLLFRDVSQPEAKTPPRASAKHPT